MTATPHADVLVRVEGLTKSFGSVHAIQDVSLQLSAGTVHALLGENGAGKSTLIGMLTGILSSDCGVVAVDDVACAFSSPRDALQLGIVAVLQRSHLVPELSILDNFRLAQDPRPVDLDVARQALTELVDRELNLTTAVGDFDFGTRVLIEIARAVARSPRLLILDEPTAQLDTGSAARLLAMIGRLRDAGMSVLFVTHKLHEVLETADQISVLRNGSPTLSECHAALVRNGEAHAEAALLAAMFGDEQNFDAATAQGSSNAPPSVEREQSQGGQSPRAHPPVLEVLDVSTPTHVGQRGLTDVSFAVHSAEIVAIAGIIGNGQSHLAQVLEGSRTPVTGSVRMLGREITALSIRARREAGLRVLSDDRFGNGLVSSLSVAFNLVLDRIGAAPFWRAGITQRAALLTHADAVIARAGVVAPSADAPAGALSGGNAQKLLLARDSDIPTAVYVYNQPTYGLDTQTVQTVHANIRERAARGEAVVLISADIDEVVHLADKILVLDAGRVVATIAGRTDQTRAALSRALAGATS